MYLEKMIKLLKLDSKAKEHLEVQSCSSLTQNLFLKQPQLFAELSGVLAAAGADVVDADVVF